MTDEELRKLMDGGIIYRGAKPCDLCTFAPTIADELLEAIALTEAEVARIDEICARGTVITDHVWAAIANPWNASLIAAAPTIAAELLEARAEIKRLTDELNRWSYGEATRK